jgi:hypothetical protein
LAIHQEGSKEKLKKPNHNDESSSWDVIKVTQKYKAAWYPLTCDKSKRWLKNMLENVMLKKSKPVIKGQQENKM